MGEGRLPLTRRRGLALLAGLTVGPAIAQSLRVTLATATPGGGFPAFGKSFAAAIRTRDPDLIIDLRPSGGSAENIALLERGEVDLALVQGSYAYRALGRHDGPKVLAPMYPTPGLFALRGDSAIKEVRDLAGRRVILGTHNSGLTILGRAVLTASGLDPDRDVMPIFLEHAGEGPAMIRDGRAAALWGGGIGWPGFVAVADAPGGARFLAPSANAIDALTREDQTLRRLTVPAHSFAGQETPITTVGSWSFVLARPAFSPEAAYRIVRALGQANGEMRVRHPQGGESDPRHLAGIVPLDALNAGTSRYVAEVGDAR
ncbi:hypothetical protein KHHGKMAE_3826 [Methylobacterium persicinum]|nr:hypothetical protein KHHGKMAE_3826 [Methylobacterium persicinum]